MQPVALQCEETPAWDRFGAAEGADSGASAAAADACSDAPASVGRSLCLRKLSRWLPSPASAVPSVQEKINHVRQIFQAEHSAAFTSGSCTGESHPALWQEWPSSCFGGPPAPAGTWPETASGFSAAWCADEVSSPPPKMPARRKMNCRFLLCKSLQHVYTNTSAARSY